MSYFKMKILSVLFLISIFSFKEVNAWGIDINGIGNVLKASIDTAVVILNKLVESFGGNGQKIAEAINKNSEAIRNATEANKNIDESVRTIKNVVVVAGTAVTVKSSFDIASYIRSWFWLSKEEKIQKALEALNKCLINNKEKAKDKDGMPDLCENVMKQYTEVAGFAALNEVKTAYAKN